LSFARSSRPPPSERTGHPTAKWQRHPMALEKTLLKEQWHTCRPFRHAQNMAALRGAMPPTLCLRQRMGHPPHDRAANPWIVLTGLLYSGLVRLVCGRAEIKWELSGI
jgi:hypothetical protein